MVRISVGFSGCAAQPRRFKVEVQQREQDRMFQASLNAPPLNKALNRAFHSGLSCVDVAFSSQESPLRNAAELGR